MAGLGYAGLLPFYGAALWALVGPADTPVTIFVVYGTVILAFLGGTLWGYAATLPAPRKHQRLILSNLVALFAAVAGLASMPLLAVALLATGQVLLVVYERSQGDRRGWYLVLRTRLVLGVLPAHLLMGWALLGASQS